MQKELIVKTQQREQMTDITPHVGKILKESKVKNGLCSIYSTHTTCSVIINENYDPNICTDILNSLHGLVPKGKWLHDSVDGNADAHIKVAMLGSSETVPVKDGRLQLGKWQSIQLVELDGPRERTLIVSIIEDG